MSGSSWSRLKRLGDAAADGDETAREQLRAVDAGRQTLYGADKSMRDSKKGDAPKREPETDIGNVGDLRSVPKKKDPAVHLNKLAERVKNLGDFAKNIDLEGLAKEEADSIAADLSEGLSALSNLRNRLRKVNQ